MYVILYCFLILPRPFFCLLFLYLCMSVVRYLIISSVIYVLRYLCVPFFIALFVYLFVYIIFLDFGFFMFVRYLCHGCLSCFVIVISIVILLFR